MIEADRHKMGTAPYHNQSGEAHPLTRHNRDIYIFLVYYRYKMAEKAIALFYLALFAIYPSHQQLNHMCLHLC
jgi:hypothetical protein